MHNIVTLVTYNVSMKSAVQILFFILKNWFIYLLLIVLHFAITSLKFLEIGIWNREFALHVQLLGYVQIKYTVLLGFWFNQYIWSSPFMW